MMRFTIIVYVLLLCLFSNLAEASNYYVAQDGDDRNTGESWSKAWRTLAHAGFTARAGDVVTVRAGRKPYLYLPVKHSGTKAKSITFRGEYKNKRPIITGGVKETRWVRSEISGVWTIPTSAPPVIVMEDNIPVEKASTKLCTDGRWYWVNNQLSYRPRGKSPGDHEVWRASMGGGIQLGDNSWIVIENFECWIGQGACIGIEKGANNIIRNIYSQWYVRGTQIRGGNSNLIEDSVFENNREGVYLLLGAHNNTVTGCQVLGNGILPAWKSGDRSGIAIGDRGVNAGNKVIDNVIAFNGGPHSDFALSAFSAPNTLLKGNYVHDNYAGGILVGVFSHDSSAIDNRVIRNGRQAVLAGEGNVSGLSVRRSRGVSVEGNQVLFNYASLSDPDRYIDRVGGGLDLKGNKGENMRGIKFINNLVCGTVNGPNVYISSVPDTTGMVLKEPTHDQCVQDKGAF